MPTQSDQSLPPILPVGTAIVSRVAVRGRHGAVVCPAGAVGVVVRCPADAEHRYRVRFPGGEEAQLHRADLQVLSHFQQPGGEGPFARETESRPEAGAAASASPADTDHPAPPAREPELFRHVIYRCVVGSRAYGLARDESDVDRRGIYLPPAELHWSLFGVPGQLEDSRTDECYWELGKFLGMALKANPNVLEVLYTPLAELVRPPADELLAMRQAFLSKLLYQTYNGYVLSQFKKLEQDLRARGRIRWKHAMHLIRLLLAGVTVLREGFVPVRVEQHREELLAIRDGRTPWEQVDAWRLALHKEFDAAYAATKLPDRPDYQAANAFLVRARRSMVDQA